MSTIFGSSSTTRIVPARTIAIPRPLTRSLRYLYCTRHRIPRNRSRDAWLTGRAGLIGWRGTRAGAHAPAPSTRRLLGRRLRARGTAPGSAAVGTAALVRAAGAERGPAVGDHPRGRLDALVEGVGALLSKVAGGDLLVQPGLRRHRDRLEQRRLIDAPLGRDVGQALAGAALGDDLVGRHVQQVRDWLQQALPHVRTPLAGGLWAATLAGSTAEALAGHHLAHELLDARDHRVGDGLDQPRLVDAVLGGDRRQALAGLPLGDDLVGRHVQQVRDGLNHLAALAVARTTLRAGPALRRGRAHQSEG